MSIQQTKEIAELRARIEALESLVRELAHPRETVQLSAVPVTSPANPFTGAVQAILGRKHG